MSKKKCCWSSKTRFCDSSWSKLTSAPGDRKMKTQTVRENDRRGSRIYQITTMLRFSEIVNPCFFSLEDVSISMLTLISPIIFRAIMTITSTLSHRSDGMHLSTEWVWRRNSRRRNEMKATRIWNFYNRWRLIPADLQMSEDRLNSSNTIGYLSITITWIRVREARAMEFSAVPPATNQSQFVSNKSINFGARSGSVQISQEFTEKKICETFLCE